MKSAAVT